MVVALPSGNVERVGVSKRLIIYVLAVREWFSILWKPPRALRRWFTTLWMAAEHSGKDSQLCERHPSTQANVHNFVNGCRAVRQGFTSLWMVARALRLTFTKKCLLMRICLLFLIFGKTCPSTQATFPARRNVCPSTQAKIPARRKVCRALRRRFLSTGMSVRALRQGFLPAGLVARALRLKISPEKIILFVSS